MAASTAKTTDHANIETALAAFQAEAPDVTKNATADTGKYGYGYATLDHLVKVLFPVLSKHGLSYTAIPDLTELGFGLRASLRHTTGEKIEGFYPLGNPGAPAQAIGSAISYARRYALLSLTGVSPAGEDDDGASAGPAAGATIPKAAPAQAAPKDEKSEIQAEMGAIINDVNNTLTGEDANRIMNEIAEGKSPSQWTVTDLRKGRDQLKAEAAAQKGA